MANPKFYRDGTPMREIKKGNPPPPMRSPAPVNKIPGGINLEDGIYNALQSGYELKIEVSTDLWTEPIRINTGVRGINCKCKAIVADQKVVVSFK